MKESVAECAHLYTIPIPCEAPYLCLLTFLMYVYVPILFRYAAQCGDIAALGDGAGGAWGATEGAGGSGGAGGAEGGEGGGAESSGAAAATEFDLGEAVTAVLAFVDASGGETADS